VLKKYLGIGGNLLGLRPRIRRPSRISQVLYPELATLRCKKIAIRGDANNREMLDPTLF
jgi:hypothetical protein